MTALIEALLATADEHKSYLTYDWKLVSEWLVHGDHQRWARVRRIIVRNTGVSGDEMLNALYRTAVLPMVKLLTRNDPESAHDWLLAALAGLQQRAWLLDLIIQRREFSDPRLRQTLLGGLSFPNPFGVAAGLDKNASVYPALIGLIDPGFIEVGGVTQQPQVGNPRPRIIRVGRDGLINNMGFPNDGAAAVIDRLATLPPPSVPLGVNLGKMRDTADVDAAQDYAHLVRAFTAIQPYCGVPHFYVINVSSPNTPGLTALQSVRPLTAILEAVTNELDMQRNCGVRLRNRLLIKLSPDLSESSIASIIELVLRFDIGGLIQSNTTSSRPISTHYRSGPGGFSGSALYDRNARLVRLTASLLPRGKVLVATGGIDTIDKAYEMLQYADLVAGYTALVLRGFDLFKRLSHGILDRMEAVGVKSLGELRHGNRPAK